MENKNQEIIDKLNHLIAIAEDGKIGYRNAAEDVKDPQMKDVFMRFSNERSGYISELQQQVLQAGGKPEDGGGPLGAMHRAIMDVKAAFTSGDTDTIINTCTTGEEAAVKEYQEALNENYIAGETRSIIARQLQGIENALATIKQYRSSTAN